MTFFRFRFSLRRVRFFLRTPVFVAAKSLSVCEENRGRPEHSSLSRGIQNNENIIFNFLFFVYLKILDYSSNWL